MSTGLTYVTIVPFPPVTTPSFGGSTTIFADYKEAYEFGSWATRVITGDGNDEVRTFIWTSSPNENGLFYVSGGESVWLPTD